MFLSLLTWILIYELINVSFSNTVKSKSIHSGVIGGVLALMPFLNVKTVILLPAVVLSIVLVKVYKKRWMVSLPTFVPAFLIAGGVCVLLVDRMILNYSANLGLKNSWTIELKSYIYSIIRGVQRLHVSHGIRGFFDLFISNIWMIAIFSCGIVVYASTYIIHKLRLGKEKEEFQEYIQDCSQA